MEFYLTIKKNKIIKFAGKWEDLEATMLSEVNQIQRDKYHLFLSYVNPCFNLHVCMFMQVGLNTGHRTGEGALREGSGFKEGGGKAEHM